MQQGLAPTWRVCYWCNYQQDQKPWLAVTDQKMHSPEVAGPRPHLDSTLLVRRHGGSGSACSLKAAATALLRSSTIAASRPELPTNSAGAADSSDS